MKIIITLLAYILLTTTCYAGNEANNVKYILNSFLEDMHEGRIMGFYDTLKIPYKTWYPDDDYFDKVQNIDKSLYIEHGETHAFVTSYRIDSISLKKDQALCFVSFRSIGNGYCLDLIGIKPQKLKEKFLLFKIDSKWYVVAFSGNIIQSPSVYIKWARKALDERTWTEGEKYRDNVIMNVKSFEKYLETH